MVTKWLQSRKASGGNNGGIAKRGNVPQENDSAYSRE